MATSGQILGFLDLLDEVGTDLGWVWGFVDDSARDKLIDFRFLSPTEVKDVQQARTIVSKDREGPPGTLQGTVG